MLPAPAATVGPCPRPSRRALVTGVTGQDGPYLCELLLAEGYEVHGLVMPGEVVPREVPAAVRLREGLLTDGASLQAALAAGQPQEIYNLAAATSVAASFDDPVAVADVTGLGVLRAARGRPRQRGPDPPAPGVELRDLRRSDELAPG